MDSPSDAQLARIIVRTLAAVIALVLAGGIASVVGRIGDDTDEQAADTVVGGAGLSPRGGAGPLPATSVTTYVRFAQGNLTDARGRRAAVVSFAGYRTPEQAAELVGGTEVVSLLVAFPGGRPLGLATGKDLTELARTERDEAAAEKKALEQLLPTVEDPDFKRQYQADIDRLGSQLATDAIRRDVVFGALVVGSSDRLRAIASRPGVRLVDLGADAEPPKPTAYSGLRPEETVEAGEPPNRPTG